MTSSPGRRLRRARWIAGALASSMFMAIGGQALALPTGGVVAGTTGGATTIASSGVTTTINQLGSRAVINWSTFNIASGETVNFAQASKSSIAFNVLPTGVSANIAGSLTANGGVWLMAPGGVIFGAHSVVNTGSFLASTAAFSSVSQTDALNSNTIELFPQSTVGASSINVDPTASITATAGFVVLQAPTINQAGAISATDGVVLNAMEGMNLTITPDPGGNGVALNSYTATVGSGGGSSNITSSGGVSAAWIELDAYNNSTFNPGVSGIINLSGHLSATGMKPGGSDSVDLVANYGAATPSAMVTTLNASGSTIDAFGGVSASAGALTMGKITAATSGTGAVTLSAGAGGLTLAGPVASSATNLVNLSASGPVTINGAVSGLGDVNVNAGGALTDNASITAGGNASLSATGPVAINAAISGLGNVNATAVGALTENASITAGGSAILAGDTIGVGANVTIRAPDTVSLHAPDGVSADATSMLSAGDTSLGNDGVVEVQAGSTLGPANLIIGSAAAGNVTLSSNAALTRPAGGVSSGPGDITVLGPVTTGMDGVLTINAARNLMIDGAANAQGSTQVNILTGLAGSGGDYSFGPGGSLNFTGAASLDPGLNINGYGYQLIYSLTDLLAVNNDLGGHYALAGPLDLANLPDPSNPGTTKAVFFTASPIANSSSIDTGGEFDGVFAGLGHAVANLNINQTIATQGYFGVGEVGLFGVIGSSGVVRDLNLVNAQVSGPDFMDIGTLAGVSTGTIQNVSTSGSVTGGLGWGPAAWAIGGLVGRQSGGLIVDSHASVSVTGGGSAWAGGLAGALTDGGQIQSSYATGAVSIGDSAVSPLSPGAAGGLVGGTYSVYSTSDTQVSITNAYATGDVHAGKDTQVGGLIGEAVAATITNAYATGAVSQDASTTFYQDQAGGFAGLIGAGSVVTNSYASGAVSSTGESGRNNVVGGFVGVLSNSGSISDSYALGSVTSSNDSLVGGFVGLMRVSVDGVGDPVHTDPPLANGPYINQVYATGAISDPSGTAPTGGLVGSLTAGTISNSFWDTGTTGVATALGANPTLVTQTNLVAVNGTTAYSGATYAGIFDLTNTWVVFDGQTRPILRSEYSTSVSNAHQLQLMALHPDASYILATDIDASETASASGVWKQATQFDPIGATTTSAFTGSLDGQGHTIDNLNIIAAPGAVAQTWGAQSSFGAAGLFGVLGAGASVSNLNLTNVHVTGGAGMDVGGLAGLSLGAIDNSSVSGTVIVGGASGTVAAAAGGLVGGSSGSITNSQSSAHVTGGAADVGGLVGWLAPGGSIANSSTSGGFAVAGASGTMNSAAGGLVGLVGTPTGGPATQASVTGSSSSDNVTVGAGGSAGGLIGVINGGQASGSSASGQVNAGQAGGAAVNAGGFVGYVTNGAVTTSYATGAVLTGAATSGTSGDAAGGFVGQVGPSGSVTTSYSGGNISANAATTLALTTNAGGFVGGIAATGAVSNSYSLADVTMVHGAGGNGSSGGFAGAVSGTVTTIYASGHVSDGNLTAGGLIGTLNATGVASIGYWDHGISPESAAVGTTVAGGSATSLASVGGSGPSAYLASSYAGFDFTNTWFLIAGETRPILRAEYSTTITNAHQLQLMALGLSADYTVANTIDASETTRAAGVWNIANGFVPVGASVAAPFSGDFDGAGHTLSNLTVIDHTGVNEILPVSGVNTLGAAGLFGYASGELSNVNLVNVHVTAGNGMSAGGLVGTLLSGSVTSSASSGTITTGADTPAGLTIAEASAGGLIGEAFGDVSFSSSSANVNGGEAQVGGLVGQLNGATILDSHATGAVTVGDYAGDEAPAAGGLVGVAQTFDPSSPATITGSFATGAVNAGTGGNAGGFIGLGSQAVITTSYATGDVTATDPSGPAAQAAVGGFAGSLLNSQVSQSFSTGSVTVNNLSGGSWVGGFAGLVSGGTITDAYSQSAVSASGDTAAGGFVGDQDGDATITRVYASGAVSGDTSLAGLVGRLSSGTLSDSYWDQDTTGQGDGYNLNGGTATGVTALGGGGPDPSLAASYGDWDFEHTWSTPAAGGHPGLYGVSHVVRLRGEDASTVYAEYPVYVVDEYGFQPLEGPSVLVGLTGGAVSPATSSSGHYVVTTLSGPYAIAFTADFGTSPDGSGSYTFVSESGNLTVTPRALDAELGTVERTYDADNDITLTGSNFTLNGTVGGDDVSVDPTLATATYDSINVGSDIGVTITGTVSLTGADAINYTVNDTVSSAPAGKIDPATLEISAVGDSKVYDATTSSNQTPVYVTGLQGSDTVDEVDLTQSFDSKNAGTSRILSVDPGSVSISDGNNGNNYTVVYDTAPGTITPAPLSISAVSVDKVYDATTSSSTTPDVSGLQGSDSIAVTQSYSGKDVGFHIISIDGDYVISDDNGGDNYTVSLSGGNGSITPAPLTITAQGDTKVYDSTTTSGVAPKVTGLQGSDDVSDLTQSFDSPNAGARALTVDAGYELNDGNGGNNYTVTVTGPASGTITKASLELTAVTDTKIYDATDTSTGVPVEVTGLQGSDTVTGLAQIFDIKNAGDRTLSISAYTVNDGNSGGNYDVTLDTVSGKITPAQLELSAVTDSKVYDGTTSSTKTPVYVIGLQGSDTVDSLTQAFASRNAGSPDLVVTGYAVHDGNSGQNYTVVTDDVAGSITPAPLTLSAVGDTKVYDATTASNGAPQITVGPVSTDTVTDLVQTFDSPNAGSRTLAVTGYTINDGNNGLNYTVTLTGADGNITPAPLTIAAQTDTKVYDSTTTSAVAPKVTGLQGSDDVSDLSQSFDSPNAGARTLTVDAGYELNDGNSGNNYTVTVTGPANGTITKASLELSAVTDTKTYDATDTSTAEPVVVTGLQGSDSVTGLSQVFDSKNAGDRLLSINGYTVNDGNNGGNYDVSLDTASGRINQATLELSAVTDTKTYDGTTASDGTPVVVTGLQGDDTVTGLAQTFDSRNAGDRLLDVSAYTVNDGADGANYIVTTDEARGSIGKADLTLSAVTQTRTYDGKTDSSTAPNVDGLVSGDSISDLSQVFDSKNAGSRTLSISSGFTVNDGNDGNNYTVATQTADGQITPATLTLEAVSETRTYDGSTDSSTTPQAVGLFAGDSVTGLTQVFDNRNAGARTLSVNAGYTVVDGNDGGNYIVSTTTAGGTITPAALTLSAVTDSKVYDGATASDGVPVEVSGLVEGDSVSGLAQAFDSKNAGARTLSVIGYAISDGNGGNNYTVTLDTAAGTITPAALTITATGDSKVYDGTTTSNGGPGTNGLVEGDNITGLTQTFDSKNAGERELLVGSGYTIDDGNGGANYTVSLISAEGTITPKPLTVDLTGQVFKIYDGTTKATLTPANYQLSGVINGDAVTLNDPTNGTYDTPQGGFGKTVTVGALNLTGADASNYTVSATAAGPVGVICQSDCIIPPVFTQIFTDPNKIEITELQFQFSLAFALDVDLPTAPESDRKRDGDQFPVTGAGNRDLWTPPPAGAASR